MSDSVNIHDLEMTPWKTERMKFEFDGTVVTLHSTGQVFVLKGGVLVKYYKLKCRFGCMRAPIKET